jgi:hypothetical protein
VRDHREQCHAYIYRTIRMGMQMRERDTHTQREREREREKVRNEPAATDGSKNVEHAGGGPGS